MKNHGLDPGAKSRVDEALEAMEINDLAESPAEENDPASYRDLSKTSCARVADIAFARKETGMKETTKNNTRELTDIRQLGETVEEIVEALQDPEVFEAIFGEPSDEEIAAIIQEAQAEFEIGDYKPTPREDDDDKPYRTRTKQEILQGIKQGFKAYLAGDVLTEEQFRQLLDE